MTRIASDKATNRGHIGAVEVRKRYSDNLIDLFTGKAYSPAQMLPFPEAW